MSSTITKVIVGTVSTVLCVLNIILITPILRNKTQNKIPYLKEAELCYWDMRYKLNKEVAACINKLAPTSNVSSIELIEQCEKYDIDLIFVLSQGLVESNLGTKGIASKTNSVWNVGAFDGLSSGEIKNKYKYSHPDKSIEPYLKLLNSKYLVNGKMEVDLMNEYVDCNGRRYASSMDYETMIRQKYSLIKDTFRITELQDSLRYYKVKSGRN